MLIMFYISPERMIVAFHEKSAWIMSLALLLGGAVYFGIVASLSAELGRLAPPNVPVVVVYTVVLVILAIIGHALVALLSPRDANSAYDERERRIVDRAGDLSGYVFGSGVLLSLALYLFTYDGNLLFYAVFASLMLGQLAEYVAQILLFRSTV